jgi:hypothetical protein
MELPLLELPLVELLLLPELPLLLLELEPPLLELLLLPELPPPLLLELPTPLLLEPLLPELPPLLLPELPAPLLPEPLSAAPLEPASSSVQTQGPYVPVLRHVCAPVLSSVHAHEIAWPGVHVDPNPVSSVPLQPTSSPNPTHRAARTRTLRPRPFCMFPTRHIGLGRWRVNTVSCAPAGL